MIATLDAYIYTGIIVYLVFPMTLTVSELLCARIQICRAVDRSVRGLVEVRN